MKGDRVREKHRERGREREGIREGGGGEKHTEVEKCVA
jgi:hypothetical protein